MQDAMANKLEKHGSNEPLQPDGPEGKPTQTSLSTLVVQVGFGINPTCIGGCHVHGSWEVGGWEAERRDRLAENSDCPRWRTDAPPPRLPPPESQLADIYVLVI